MIPRPIPKTSIGELAPATTSRRRFDAKLLIVGDSESPRHTTIDHFADVLNADDLVVVNNAATMPARLCGALERSGEPVEIRLALHLGAMPEDVERWLAVSIGVAPYNTLTEERSPGVPLEVGDVIHFGRLSAHVETIVDTPGDSSGLLFEVRFSAEGSVFQAIHENAHPIQYAHLEERLFDWDQQTIFSGPAVAVEPPSSGFHLSWETFLKLRERGIEVVAITHATGLSTTGNDTLDRLLPFPEYSHISKAAAESINAAKIDGRRIVSIGTGVARAVESSAKDGVVQPGRFTSLIRLCINRKPEVVDALLSGLHEPGSSHLALLESFVSGDALAEAYQEAEGNGYLGHEYGDLELVFRSPNL